jgi:hypothetical protein
MATTHLIRSIYDYYRCSPGVKRPGGFFGRHPVYEQEVTHDAVSALELGHLGAEYVPEADGWISSKRWCPHGIAGALCQPSGYGCSLHNYCLAYDIEYNYNKHIKARTYPEDFDEWWFPAVCKYTLEQVYAIEGIKNVHGEQLWKWLGWSIGDFMHWQINVADPRVDWNTVPGVGVEGSVIDSRKILDLVGPDGLLNLKAAGAWIGTVSWYFDGSSDAEEGANDNLVEHLIAWSLKEAAAPGPMIEYARVVKDIS